jgi:hypothetical protein
MQKWKKGLTCLVLKNFRLTLDVRNQSGTLREPYNKLSIARFCQIYFTSSTLPSQLLHAED